MGKAFNCWEWGWQFFGTMYFCGPPEIMCMSFASLSTCVVISVSDRDGEVEFQDVGAGDKDSGPSPAKPFAANVCVPMQEGVDKKSEP